jgi:hypothetical protein
MPSNNRYWFSEDGNTGYAELSTGEVFCFDAEDYAKISDRTWYRCNAKPGYVGDNKGYCIHRVIIAAPAGYEIDHINLNPLDNRKCNLRVCTHQQNQCNQPLQSNNTSGVSGVSYYPPRQKYRARIKCFQRELHLGYYNSFIEAVQARNEGMRILFGEFGRVNKAPPTPRWIREKVRSVCNRFKEEAVFLTSHKEVAARG